MLAAVVLAVIAIDSGGGGGGGGDGGDDADDVGVIISISIIVSRPPCRLGVGAVQREWRA